MYRYFPRSIAEFACQAGLFSAVVTAFIIESYRTLTQDPAYVTIALLAQISNQLANGTNAIIASPTPDKVKYHIPGSSIRANTLLFLSLFFSLMCALVATLVQQWSRNYLHATQRRPSIYKRARIRSYLHKGLERFGMFQVVNAIPTLLHFALFLFFGGLSEILRPINTAISYFILGVLFICFSIYIGTATVSVVIRNFPYRNPVSTMLWRILTIFRSFQRRLCHRARRRTKLPKNMEEEMELLAMVEDQNRDLSALRWTLENLTDNAELQPFVEGIAGFMVSPDIPPHIVLPMVADFFQDDNWALISRIQQLLSSCDKILESSHRQRRLIACLTSTWMLGYVLIHQHDGSFRTFRYRIEALIRQIAAVPELADTAGHWARCAGALLIRVIIRHDVVPGDDLILSIISRTPSLEFYISDVSTRLGTRSHTDDRPVGSYNLDEAHLLAFSSLLAALSESPNDPMGIARHPKERKFDCCWALSYGHRRVNMALVRPKIQSAFVAAVRLALNTQGTSISETLDPNPITLGDPTSIKYAVAILNAYNSSDGAWEPVIGLASLLIGELERKLRQSPTSPQSQETLCEGNIGTVRGGLGKAGGLGIEVADSGGKVRFDSGVGIGGPRT